MKIEKKKLILEGVLLLYINLYKDDRGSFSEVYSKVIKKKINDNLDWKQDNESVSHKNVFRGLHFQRGIHSQSKLIRVSNGKILDIMVDLRKNSKTFKKHLTIKIDSRNMILFIPKGIAHGFLSLSDNTIVNYKCDNLYNPKSEDGINPFKSNLKINWGVNKSNIKISSKDNNLPSLNQSYTF